MGKLRWSRQSLYWLRQIRDHIAQDNSDAARRTIEGILQRAEVLKAFPEIGQRYLGNSKRDVRILLYGHYRITYLLTSDRDVQILGIFHGAMDIRRFLE